MGSVIARLSQYNQTTKGLPSKERSTVVKFLHACEDDTLAEHIQLSYPVGDKWYSKKAMRALHVRLGEVGKMTDPLVLFTATVTKLQKEGFHAPSKDEFTDTLKERFYSVLSLKCVDITGKVAANVTQLSTLLSDAWYKSDDADKIEEYATVIFDATRFYCLIDNIVRVYTKELNRTNRRGTWIHVIKDTLNVDFS